MSQNALHKEIDIVKGILISLLGYFFVALMGTTGKAVLHSIPIMTILFFQNLVCLVLISPTIIKGGLKNLGTQHPGLYVIRIISGLACYVALFYTIKYMPLAQALLFQYSSSLWIPFIALIWLKIRILPNLWWGIIIGFIGITLILKPTAEMVEPIILVGILCGLLQAISIVAIRKLSSTEPASRILFYYFLSLVLVTSPFALKEWSPIQPDDFLLLITLGVFTYLSQKCITVSLAYAKSSTLAPIAYTSILFSGILGWLIWNEIPSPTSFIGMLLVIVGGVMATFFGKKRQQQLAQSLS